jgi:hypothetical protein
VSMWDKFNKHVDPNAAEQRGSKKGTRDAWCTECEEWYDSSNDREVNKHAH